MSASADLPADGTTRADSSIIAESLDRPDAFAALFDRHFTAVYRYVARRLGADIAEDVAAEVFLLAFNRRQSYDLSRSNALPWLLGFAANLARHQRRAEVRALRALARTGLDPVFDDIAERVVGRVVAETWYRAAASALADLSPGDRDVLLLVAWEGLSYEEVVAALGVPLGTVRSRLHRARQRMRSALDAADPGGRSATGGRHG